MKHHWLGRVLALLVASGGLGPAQAPTPPKPMATTQAAASEPQLQKLRRLVEAAEKALKEGDEEVLGERVEEALVLVTDWPEAMLKRQDVAELLERLRLLEAELEGTDGDSLKAKEEVVALTGEDLRAELARVRAAEEGVTYDFPIDLNDKVATWVHLFTTSKRGFMEGALMRANRYLPMIRQIFAEEGVPMDLAYLALIESGYRNVARSRAAAVGMWQFIRSTGKIYGLKNTAWVDERRDPARSTRAAARYLRRLYETQGDWYLALAGYNAGPLTVDRGATALGTRNYWDLARSRYLRTETKNYVPQMCAAVLIGRSPERYGFRFFPIEPLAYEFVEVDRMTSLQVLARHAGTDVETLKELNPELLRGSTPPGSYQLRVPPGQSLPMMRALARIPSRERLDFRPYTVRKGDTLAKVAARFKVSADDLLETNGLLAAQFRVGRVIKVPPPPSLPVDARDLMPARERAGDLTDQPLPSLPALPEAPGEARAEPAPAEPRKAAEVRPAELSPAAPRRDPKPSSRSATHRVKSGDTLFSIAARYGVDVKSLRKWNRLKGNRIQAGQVLKIQKP